MHYFRKRSFYLLIVSVWLAFAPGLFNLHRVYANEALPVPEAETTEGQLNELPSMLSEMLTAKEAIEEFNLGVFQKEEVEPEDILKVADSMLGQIILKIYSDADDEVAQDLENFYQAIQQVAESSNSSNIVQQGIGLIQSNRSASKTLSTILTYGRWMRRGGGLRSVRVNIAGSMLRSLGKIGDPGSIPNRGLLRPVRHLVETGSRRFPLLRRGTQAVSVVAPAVAQSLERIEKILGPIGLLISAHNFATNQDIQAGVFNYQTLNTGMSLLFSSIGFALSFFAPASIIFAAVSLIVLGAQFTIELIASHYERRRAAYRASYDFLMATDPSFPVDAQRYREVNGLESERDILNKYYLMNREKLTSFILAESGDPEDRLAANDANNQRILERYKAIWSAKADILGSRRNWQSSSGNYFSSLVDFILPGKARNSVNQVSIFEMFSSSREERRERTEELEVILDDFHPLVANPDFALIVLFDNYAEFGRHEADEDKIELLLARIKKNPFLFPYMLEIPQMQYSNEIFEQAIAVDSVNTGWLELSNLTEILRQMEEGIDSSTLETDGAIRTLLTLYSEAQKMSCCSRFLANVAELYLQDEESEIDVMGETHVELDSNMDLYSGRQILEYLDEFTDEDLESAVYDEEEITANVLFELSEFQDAVKNFIAAAALTNANFFINMQKTESIASVNEMLFVRLCMLLSQAKNSFNHTDEAVDDERINEFYAEGRYLGERDGGILGFVSGNTPLRERHEEELARLEHVIENIGRALMNFRGFFVTGEKVSQAFNNLRQQAQANGAEFPDGFRISDASFIHFDRVEKVVEYQQQLKELLEKLQSIDSIESPIESGGEFADNIYLSSDFELQEYSANAELQPLEAEN